MMLWSHDDFAVKQSRHTDRLGYYDEYSGGGSSPNLMGRILPTANNFVNLFVKNKAKISCKGLIFVDLSNKIKVVSSKKLVKKQHQFIHQKVLL